MEWRMILFRYWRTDVALSGAVVSRIIPMEALRRRCDSLKECSALCEDGFKCVDFLLCNFPRSITHRRELDADKSTDLWPQIPSRDKVAARRFVENLRRRWKREIELGREVKMEIEIFFWRSIGRLSV